MRFAWSAVSSLVSLLIYPFSRSVSMVSCRLRPTQDHVEVSSLEDQVGE